MDRVGRKQPKAGRGAQQVSCSRIWPEGEAQQAPCSRIGPEVEAQQVPCSRIGPEGMGPGCRRQKRGEKRR